jgi:hypothetical protein
MALGTAHPGCSVRVKALDKTSDPQDILGNLKVKLSIELSQVISRGLELAMTQCQSA